jgi:hypothetical protein
MWELCRGGGNEVQAAPSEGAGRSQRVQKPPHPTRAPAAAMRRSSSVQGGVATACEEEQERGAAAACEEELARGSNSIV